VRHVHELAARTPDPSDTDLLAALRRPSVIRACTDYEYLRWRPPMSGLDAFAPRLRIRLRRDVWATT